MDSTLPPSLHPPRKELVTERPASDDRAAAAGPRLWVESIVPRLEVERRTATGDGRFTRKVGVAAREETEAPPPRRKEAAEAETEGTNVKPLKALSRSDGGPRAPAERSCSQEAAAAAAVSKRRSAAVGRRGPPDGDDMLPNKEADSNRVERQEKRDKVSRTGRW